MIRSTESVSANAVAYFALLALLLTGLFVWACADSTTDDTNSAEPADSDSDAEAGAESDAAAQTTHEDEDGFISIPGEPVRVRFYLGRSDRGDDYAPLQLVSASRVEKQSLAPRGFFSGAIAAGTAPTLSNGAFVPNNFVATFDCNKAPGDAGFVGFCTQLEFNVCDPDNDLLGGFLNFFNAGTSERYVLLDTGAPVPWSYLTPPPLPNASNCASPALITIGVVLDPAVVNYVGNYSLPLDLTVSDSQGNNSNTLSNIPLAFSFPNPCAAGQCDISTSAGLLCVNDGDGAVPAVGDNPCKVCDFSANPTGWTWSHIGSSCDNGNFCDGIDSCTPTGCVPDGNPCIEDGLYCNGITVCDEAAKTCTLTPPPICPPPADLCQKNVCDEATDSCVAQPKCADDGLYCDGAESCDPVTHSCLSSGNPCGDGLSCNGVEICIETTKSCQSGPPPCPEDGVFCNGTTTCSETLGCQTTPACPDDGTYCNGSETCNETARSCGHSGDPCLAGNGLFCDGQETCSEILRSCVSPGSPCPPDDGVFCNGLETCNETTNSCVVSMPCPDDGDFCTGMETCVESSKSCGHTGDPCLSDGLFCDGVESCNALTQSCGSAGNPCPADQICFETADSCGYSPNRPLISAASWNPNYVTWTLACETNPCTQLEWSVCDPDGNLAGGSLYIFHNTTRNPFPIFGANSVPWTDILPSPPGNVTNCASPYPVSLGLFLQEAFFTSGYGTYIPAMDMQATDADGNWSNLLSNIPLSILYGPATTTTIPSTTTTSVSTSTTTTTIGGQYSPGLRNVRLDPPTVFWTTACATTYCSFLELFVCDQDNDLQGGNLYLTDTNNFMTQGTATIPWTSLITFPVNAGSCGSPYGPIRIGVPLPESLFTTGPGLYTALPNLQASDAGGRLSTTVTGLSLTVYYNTSTTTTPPTTTTTTTTVAPTTTTTNTGPTTTSTVAPTTTTSTTTTTVPGLHAPVLSNGFWNPSTVDWVANCATQFCTQLEFSVCDQDNDLQGGFMTLDDVNGLIAAAPINIPWTDYIAFPQDMSNCAAPYGPVIVGVRLPESIFGAADALYTSNVQIQGTDGAGYVSNALTGLILDINYVPGTTTTTFTGSTTTTTIPGQHAPVLSGGRWNPNTLDWETRCATEFCTQLEFTVCDQDNNLEGGSMTLNDVNGLIIDAPINIPWTDYITFPQDMSNCAAPYGPVIVGVLLPESIFGAADTLFTSNVTIRGTDGAGYISNTLSGLILDINKVPPTTTTTVTSSTTTTTIPGQHPPVLSGGRWNPNTLDWETRCATEYCTQLEFSVCDQGNDLEGGFITLDDVSGLIIDAPVNIPWTDYITFPQPISNCAAPYGPVIIGVVLLESIFGAADTLYTSNVEIYGSDNAGYVSNTLTGLILDINYVPGSTTTTTAPGTTTTTSSPTTTTTSTEPATTTTTTVPPADDDTVIDDDTEPVDDTQTDDDTGFDDDTSFDDDTADDTTGDDTNANLDDDNVDDDDDGGGPGLTAPASNSGSGCGGCGS